MSTACPPAPLTRRRLLGLSVAALGAGFALPELLRAAPSARAATRTGLVAVVGDSLTVGTEPYQADELRDAGWSSATVNAFIGRGIATKMDADPFTGLAAVDAVRSNGAEPDLWIVALGTNDVGLVAESGYPALIARMLDRIGDHPVLWVNIHLPRNTGRQAAWNAALGAAAAAPGRQLRVFDWSAIAAAHPSWLTSDGVHYTGTGYQQRAIAIAEAATVEFAVITAAQPSVRVAAAPVALVATGEPARLTPLDTPVRMLDTRGSGRRFAAGEIRTIDLTGVIPQGSSSVVVNLTATASDGDGYLTVWDAARSRPTTSNVNLSPNRTVATHTSCTCTSGRLAVGASTATHVIVDVQAAFGPDGELGLRPLVPRRLHDSRATGDTVDPGTVLTLAVPGTGSSTAARAAIVSITLADVVDGGYVTVWPAGETRPATSNLNAAPVDGAVVNTAHVRLDADGRFHVATTARGAVIVDLLAVYDDGADALSYQAAEPARVLDTRTGVGGWQGPPAADQTIDVALDAPGSVMMAGVIALAANRPGYLVAWSGQGTAPPSSTLNVSTGDVRSVWAPVTASTTGTLRIDAVGGGGADVIVDVSGWYVRPA